MPLFVLFLSDCVRVGFEARPRNADARLSDKPADRSPELCGACPDQEVCGVGGRCVPAITTDKSLVAWWPLDEPVDSTTFRDGSPNANDGACTVCPLAGVPGVRGSAVEFRTAGDPINVKGGPSLTSLTKALTVSAWVRLREHSQYGYILSNNRDCSKCGGPYAGFALWGAFYRGAPTFDLSDGVSGGPLVCTAPAVLPLDEWHYVAGTFNGDEMRLYVDGQLTSSRSGVSLAAPPSFETRIGGMGYDSQLSINAIVDEVMVFSRALDATEISGLHAYYAAHLGGK